MKLNDRSQIIGKVQFVLTTPFKLIIKYCLSKKGDNAIVIGDSNKIHLYSLDDYRLKYCLESSHPMNRIINIAISKKNKFFSLLYENYNLEIYNLIEEKKINTNCECVNQLLLSKFENNKENNPNNLAGAIAGKFFNTTLSKFKVRCYIKFILNKHFN